MKKLIALILLSPLVSGETYSCINENENAVNWNKQVVYERKDDYFISTSDNAFSVKNKDFPKSKFDWDIYSEDGSGIILITQGGQLKKEIENIHAMFLRVVFISKRNQTFREYDLAQLSSSKKTDKAKGSCLALD